MVATRQTGGHKVREVINRDYSKITYPSETGKSDARERKIPEHVTLESIQEKVRYNRLKVKPGSSKLSIPGETTATHDEAASGERERYNKLKINTNQLHSSEKLRRIMHANSMDSVLASTPTSHQGKKPTHRSAKVACACYEKYKKEEHAHRHHAVKTSTELSKSKSTGDLQACMLNTPTHTLTLSKSGYDLDSASDSCSTDSSPYLLPVRLTSAYSTPSLHPHKLQSPPALPKRLYSADSSPSLHPGSTSNADSLPSLHPPRHPSPPSLHPGSISNADSLPSLHPPRHLSSPSPLISKQSSPSPHHLSKQQCSPSPHHLSKQQCSPSPHHLSKQQRSPSSYHLSKQQHSPSPHHPSKLHPEPAKQQVSAASADTPFLNKMITFTCGHEGKEINSTAYDFSVKIAKGTLKKRKSTEFNIGFCLHGPFNFPKGYQLVSPILLVTAQPHKLRKPMEVALSHCIEKAPHVEKRDLMFFHAAKNNLSQTYSFKPTDINANQFELYCQQGKLSTTDLGFFCILTKEMTQSRKHTNYCVVPVVPRQRESSSWKIHYCVTLHLKASVMVGTIARSKGEGHTRERGMEEGREEGKEGATHQGKGGREPACEVGEGASSGKLWCKGGSSAWW